jgi:glyoxylase-like metal-dependent hydrolase (beta-lactamase superfamily II)
MPGAVPRHGAEAWFVPREIVSGLWLIAEPGHVCSWIVEGTERAALIDTGLGIDSIRPVAEQLTARPLVVVNTHYHFDHVGGNHEFDEIAIHRSGAAMLRRQANPDALASYMRFTRRRLELLPQLRSLDEWFWMLTPEEEPRPLPKAFDPAGWTIRPSVATRLLEDGDRIDLGGRSLSVIHTPGHSPDSICLLEEREGWLAAGDTLCLGGIYCQYPDSDLRQFADSVERLAGLRESVSLLLTGHIGHAIAETSLLDETRDALSRILEGNVALSRSTDEFDNSVLVAAFDRVAFSLPDPEAPAASLTVGP